MKIAVVEDQTLVREMLVAACRDLWPSASVSMAETGAEGLSLCAVLQPNLVFLDLWLPDGDGLGFVPQVVQASPHSRIVALTSFVDEFTVHQALRSSVHGLITKREQSLDKLKSVADLVLAGGQYFSPAVQSVREALRSNPRSFDKLLTDHEQRLLTLFGEGMNNRLVAEKLGLSTNTVQVHRRNILAKLGMHSTPELMNYALEKGFRRVANA